MSCQTPPSKAPGSASQFTVCKTSERTRPAFQLDLTSDSSSSSHSEDSESEVDDDAGANKLPASKDESSVAVTSLQGDLESALRLSDDSNNRAYDSPCSSASESPERLKSWPRICASGKPSLRSCKATEPDISLRSGGDVKVSSNDDSSKQRARQSLSKPKKLVDCRPLREISDPASNLVTQAKLDTFFSKAPKKATGPSLKDAVTNEANESIESLLDKNQEPKKKDMLYGSNCRLPYDPTTSSLITQEKIDAFFAPHERPRPSEEEPRGQVNGNRKEAVPNAEDEAIYGSNVSSSESNEDSTIETEAEDNVTEAISFSPRATNCAIDPSAAPDMPGFSLPPALWQRLYPHQRTGVSWLRQRYCGRDGVNSEGCLLGDAMGMGKTIQTCSLLAGLFRGGGARLALVVAPVSCLHAWREELERTFQGLQVTSLEGGPTAKTKGTQHKNKVKKHVTDQWDNSGSSSSSDDDEMETSTSSGWLQRHSAISASTSHQAGSSAVRVEELTSHLSASKRLDLLASIAHDAGVAASRLKARSLKGNCDSAKTAKQNHQAVAESSSSHALGGCGGGCAVVLCSYGLFGAIKDLDEVERKMAPNGGRRGCSWDAVILDEGHKIKTHSAKVTQAIRALPTKWRLLLTGTPIQNNLKELWALYNFLALPNRPEGSGQLVNRASRPSASSPTTSEFVCETEVDGDASSEARNHDGDNEDLASLGDWPSFKQRFADPIERARHADANLAHQQVGRRRAAWLRRIVGKFTLQRSKESLRPQASAINTTDPLALGLPKGGNSSTTAAESTLSSSISAASASECPSLPPKHEVVLWVGLSESQRRAYEQYLKGTAVQKALGSMSTGPLVAIAHLKKITSHVILAKSAENPSIWSDDDSDNNNDEDSVNNNYVQGESHHASIDWTKTKAVEGGSGKGGLQLDVGIPAKMLLQGSHKLAVLVALVNDLAHRGHKTLVFSQSVRMLHLIAHCLDYREGLVESDLGVVRIDGSVGASERASRVKAFNSTPCKSGNPRVMLLTTGVGALGLTLTGADRVIMYDPSWNPSEDAQAVDRAHRFGQTREVVTYRMIGAGTVEEKVYEKQVFKDGLRRTLAADNKSDIIDDQDSLGSSSSRGNGNNAEGNEELTGKRQEAHRYFTRDELRRVFELGPEGCSDAMNHLHAAHGTTQQWASRLHDTTTSDTGGAFMSELAALEELFSGKASSVLSAKDSAESVARAGTASLSDLCAVRGLLVGTSPHDALYTALAPGSATAVDSGKPQDDVVLGTGAGCDQGASSESELEVDDVTKGQTRRHYNPHRKHHRGASVRMSVGRNNAPREDFEPSTKHRDRRRRRSSAVLVIDQDAVGASDGVILIEESDGEEEPWSGGGDSFETHTLIDEFSDEDEGYVGVSQECSDNASEYEIDRKTLHSEEAEEVPGMISEESGDSEPSDGETLVDESRSSDDINDEVANSDSGDDEENGNSENDENNDSSVVIDLRGLTLSELAGDFAGDQATLPEESTPCRTSAERTLANIDRGNEDGALPSEISDLVDTDEENDRKKEDQRGSKSNAGNRSRLRRPFSDSQGNQQSQLQPSSTLHKCGTSDNQSANEFPGQDAPAVARTLAAATRHKAGHLTTAAVMNEWQERQDRAADLKRQADDLCRAGTSNDDAAHSKEIRNLRMRALEECLEALEIADDDAALHWQIVSLVHDLGLDLNH